MGVVFRVAGVAVLRCCSQVGDGMCVDVADRTVQRDVFPNQREWETIVVEIIPIRINPVVASPAIGPE
jgi:hypothetical protein